MPSGARGVVLVVEDHPDTCELYGVLLSAAGFRCLPAWNPDDAMRHAKGEPIDVAVLDLGLPRLEQGLALAQSLQDLPNAPLLIALTGHREDLLPKGVFRAYLMKPFEPEALVEVLSRLLSD